MNHQTIRPRSIFDRSQLFHFCLIGFWVALNVLPATAQTKKQSAPKKGIQFVYPEMERVDEMIRQHRVVIGTFEWIKKEKGFVYGSLHYPGMNDRPVKLYMDGPFKIKGWIKDSGLPEKFRGDIVLRYLDDDTCEMIGYSRMSNGEDDRFVEDKEKYSLNFRYDLFRNKKYRYEKFIPINIERLKSKDTNLQFEGMLDLIHLGKQAAPAVPHLSKLVASENLDVMHTAIRTLHAVAGPKPLVELSDQTVPRLIELMKLRKTHRNYQATSVVGLFGKHAKAAIPELVKLLQRQLDDPQPNAVQIISTGRAMMQIDSTNESVHKAIEPLAKHRYQAVRKEAKRWLKQIDDSKSK